MVDAARWSDLRTRVEALEPGSQLETPVSDRRFAIESIADDGIDVSYVDSGESRTLWREQFDVLTERLDDHPIHVDSLQPGVEPYAAVLSLAPDVRLAGDELVYDPDEATAGESPYVVSPAEARAPPTRLRDDALLLADHVERLDLSDPAELETVSLTDAYVVSSDVQHGANRLRKTLRDELLARLGPDQQLHGRFGTVRRTTRTRRSVRDEETVFEALDERGIPREWVLGVDRTKLDVVLSVTDLDESDVYDVDESVYVQKIDVDEDEKFELLAGIRDRLDALEGAEGEAIREELTDIESRIEDALAGD
ncbi:hypothetical protein [Halovivax limisalsi]|uniref:hypothetical protein n=1 Tax=Halovivax limisalsi TaxID=1453760 RepID=UPI001FFCA096|nr:hypothetical protein [Halovivax limisalsi]